MKECGKQSVVEKTSHQFNGGSEDTAKLYDVAKFIERTLREEAEGTFKNVRSLEDLLKKAHKIITDSRFLHLERSIRSDVYEYFEMVKKFNEQK